MTDLIRCERCRCLTSPRLRPEGCRLCRLDDCGRTSLGRPTNDGEAIALVGSYEACRLWLRENGCTGVNRPVTPWGQRVVVANEAHRFMGARIDTVVVVKGAKADAVDEARRREMRSVASTWLPRGAHEARRARRDAAERGDDERALRWWLSRWTAPPVGHVNGVPIYEDEIFGDGADGTVTVVSVNDLTVDDAFTVPQYGFFVGGRRQ